MATEETIRKRDECLKWIADVYGCDLPGLRQAWFEGYDAGMVTASELWKEGFKKLMVDNRNESPCLNRPEVAAPVLRNTT